MTRGAPDLFHDQEQRVAVAVDPYFPDDLHVTAFLAFAPKFISAAGEVHGAAGSNGLVKRLLVHEGIHEDVSGLEVLSDRPDQSVCLAEVGPVHWKGVQGLIT